MNRLSGKEMKDAYAEYVDSAKQGWDREDRHRKQMASKPVVVDSSASWDFIEKAKDPAHQRTLNFIQEQVSQLGHLAPFCPMSLSMASQDCRVEGCKLIKLCFKHNQNGLPSKLRKCGDEHGPDITHSILKSCQAHLNGTRCNEPGHFLNRVHQDSPDWRARVAAFKLVEAHKAGIYLGRT